MKTQLPNFLARRGVGLILRTFATKPEDVAARVKQVRELVDTVGGIRIAGTPVLKRIDVPVFADKRFGSRADCGDTADALKQEFRFDSLVTIHVVAHGDLFCGLLNFGVAQQLRHRVDYSLIMSSEARSYCNQETIEALLSAMMKGAKASGVAINELTDSIMKGRLANTFAMWDNMALLTVGGFDLRAAMPVDDRAAHHVRGVIEGEDVYYAIAGVEEVIPLARLVEVYGPCIAPIRSRGDGVQVYQVPDQETQRELWGRHTKKMGTKLQRQLAHLFAIRMDPSILEYGVMDGYRE